MAVVVKRIYESTASGDGYRVLVDRLWPRGFSRERAAIDQWMKDIAPTNELRNWYGHDPLRWPEFRRRYCHELEGNEPQLLDELRRWMAAGNVTLLTAAKDTEHSNAWVLKELLEGN